jgi:hypothetical protein
MELIFSEKEYTVLSGRKLLGGGAVKFFKISSTKFK